MVITRRCTDITILVRVFEKEQSDWTRRHSMLCTHVQLDILWVVMFGSGVKVLLHHLHSSKGFLVFGNANSLRKYRLEEWQQAQFSAMFGITRHFSALLGRHQDVRPFYFLDIFWYFTIQFLYFHDFVYLLMLLLINFQYLVALPCPAPSLL